MAWLITWRLISAAAFSEQASASAGGVVGCSARASSLRARSRMRVATSGTVDLRRWRADVDTLPAGSDSLRRRVGRLWTRFRELGAGRRTLIVEGALSLSVGHGAETRCRRGDRRQ